jgi:COP9 signalosome complex subunit 4
MLTKRNEKQGRTLDGFYSLLEWAVIQHNLLAASKLYLNIGFAALGGLLGITALEAEQTASKMIAEERLLGKKDERECDLN